MNNKMYILLCAMLVILSVGGTSIKGLYCKDPDTGKLYPVNSTWQSESFCGNYTCKLRLKNLTQTEYRPVPTINITADKIRKNAYVTDDMSVSPSQPSNVIVKSNLENKQSDFHKDLINRFNELTIGNNGDLLENKDRYLTESEIKIITEMLHTVKKSDLEAIVEIYNLAQDIYKEMDITTTEKLVKETKHNNMDDKNEVKAKLKSNSHESISYWYEPLHHHNSKTKPTDSKIDETNPPPAMRSYPYPSSYFKGPLTEKDFGKLPYYYPLSNFQRMSSYLHNSSPYAPPPYVPPPSDHRPCNKHFNNIATQSWYGQPVPPKKISSDIHNRPRAMHPTQSMLLPYPFSYVNHYNFSSYPASFYYSNYPWAQLDIYNRHKNNPHSYYGTNHPQMPKTEVIVNEDFGEKFEDSNNIIDDDKVVSFENDEDKGLPDWQTAQLSSNILEEVKANILEKSKLLKPLSLRKNVKLEKVSKLINIDELLRSKRDLNGHGHKEVDNKENSQLEVYIERKTCESSIEPGFFRVGNETEPFPACCPQMIKTEDKKHE